MFGRNALFTVSSLLAVNKMDLVSYDQQTFDTIVADFRAFAETIGVKDFTPIPISEVMQATCTGFPPTRDCVYWKEN